VCFGLNFQVQARQTLCCLRILSLLLLVDVLLSFQSFSGESRRRRAGIQFGFTLMLGLDHDFMF